MAPKLTYTSDQIQFIVDARLVHGLEFRTIAARFSERYGGTWTNHQMRSLFGRWRRGEIPGGAGVAETGGAAPAEPDHPYADFTRASFDGAVVSAEVKRGRYFVTAACPVSNLSQTETVGSRQIGRNLHVPFFGAIQTFCAAQGAELVILPMRAHMPALTKQPSYYDPRLEPFRDKFASDFQLNENLRALDVYLNPQQIAPLTGLYRLRGRTGTELVFEGPDGREYVRRFNQSLIVASPKQDMTPVATGNGSIARILHSTGACTRPEYLRNRMGRIAEEMHIVGGLIVEVEDDWFSIRQVQAHPVHGGFYDFGTLYTESGVSHGHRAEALRPGDVHAGLEDPLAMESTASLARLVRPKRVFVEDVFDGGSITHHNQKKNLTRATLPVPFRSLSEELAWCRDLLAQLADETAGDDGEVYIVESNHHDHLLRWLEEGRYLKDDTNFALGHRMVVEILDGIDPLRVRLDPTGRYRWLGSEDDLYVEGIQQGSHGHIGVNGMRGSPAQMERIHGTSMSGHAHGPGIQGRHVTVGHISRPRHGYNKGASTWLDAKGVVWPGGLWQLVISIDGKFRLED